MNIMYSCPECGSYCGGMLQQITKFGNTKNMDELGLVCEFCGYIIGRIFTEREFCGWRNNQGELVGTKQADLWAERRADIVKKNKNGEHNAN